MATPPASRPESGAELDSGPGLEPRDGARAHLPSDRAPMGGVAGSRSLGVSESITSVTLLETSHEALLAGPGAGALFVTPSPRVAVEGDPRAPLADASAIVPATRANQPHRGIAFMLAATLSFVAMSAFVKLLREQGMSTTEVMFWRSAPGALVMLGVLAWRGVSLIPSDWVSVAMRCLFGTLAMAGNFFAVGYLSLAQHGTLHLTQPIFVAAISPALLGERASRYTLLALALAGVGAAIVLAPGLDVSSLPLLAALAGLMGALMAALAAITIRRATRTDSPDLIVFHFAAATGLLCLVVGLARGEMNAVWQGGSDLKIIGSVVGVAGLGLLGQMFLSRAYGAAKALVVAIIGYVAIPLNFFIDAIVWDTPPTLAGLTGATLVICASGLLLRDSSSAPNVRSSAERKR